MPAMAIRHASARPSSRLRAKSAALEGQRRIASALARVFGPLFARRDADGPLPHGGRNQRLGDAERGENAFDRAQALPEAEGACRSFSRPCADKLDEGVAGVSFREDVRNQWGVERAPAGRACGEARHVDDVDQSAFRGEPRDRAFKANVHAGEQAGALCRMHACGMKLDDWC